MKPFIYLLCFLFCFSVNAQDSLKIDGDITNAAFWSQLAIYSIGDPIEFKKLEQDFSSAFPNLKINLEKGDSVIINAADLYYYNNAQTEFPPHDLQLLQYLAEHLSDRQKQLLNKSNEVAVIGVYGKQTDTWEINKKIDQWIADYTKDKQWIIFDQQSAEYFTPESWKTTRVNSWTAEIPRLDAQIAIHAYREDAFCRLVSLGMQKFGLPDIIINDASCFNIEDFMLLINITAQRIAEQPQVYKNQLAVDINKIKNKSLRTEVLNMVFENAIKKAILSIKPGVWQEGDPFNQMIEIDFNSTAFENPQVYQENIIKSLFGSKGEVRFIDHSDALLEASEKAKAQLPRLKEQFNKGLEIGSSLLLKAPFMDDDGSNEWMWIEVTNWDANDIAGILQNEPFNIKKLKVGAKVKAVQSEIFDYILYLPDGTYEGNTTGAIIQQMQDK